MPKASTNRWVEKAIYLTGVVAPEPPRDEQFCELPCIGEGNSELPEFACEINHESTSCRVAFLNTRPKTNQKMPKFNQTAKRG